MNYIISEIKKFIHEPKKRLDTKEENISAPMHTAIQIIQIKHRRKTNLKKKKKLKWGVGLTYIYSWSVMWKEDKKGTAKKILKNDGCTFFKFLKNYKPKAQ